MRSSESKRTRYVTRLPNAFAAKKSNESAIHQLLFFSKRAKSTLAGSLLSSDFAEFLSGTLKETCARRSDREIARS
ncbi:hypothetical protein PUN28_000286 [Cardiocondyla obscurior]|uniref:Uncharacterized protein n=1 Tax=Cardiocondyla obscurior TaxID=286306 RepID=A0AAW2GZ25_9HYME